MKHFVTYRGFAFLAFQRWALIKSKQLKSKKTTVESKNKSKYVASETSKSVELKCPICFKVFRSKQGNVNRHLKRHKELVKRYKCVICNGTYSQKSNFEDHKKTARHASADPNEITYTIVYEKMPQLPIYMSSSH